MAITDRSGLPLAVDIESASPAEVKLAPELLCEVKRRVGIWPQRRMADKAYDSDHFRYLLKAVDGELICPHRRNRKRPPMQDGRKLRRYKKRWKVERFFAWLFNSRRTVVRYEYHHLNYAGFIHLARTPKLECFLSESDLGFLWVLLIVGAGRRRRPKPTMSGELFRGLFV